MKIKSYLPDQILSNDDLAVVFPEWSPRKIEKKIGIKRRHISASDETALDMALKVCETLLTDNDREIIDFVLLCTQSPDYYLPTSACMLQDRLRLKTGIGAFDYNLGCSGFIYGLSLAKGLIISGIASNVLLVMSETYTKHIHPLDKGNRSIFGDGAAAVLLNSDDISKIHNFSLGTDGRGWQNLIIPNGGLRKRFDENAIDWTDENGILRNDNNLYMNGPEIFNFTIEAVPKLIEEVLSKNKCTIDDIDYVIFHQANQYMLQYLRDLIKIPEDKFYINMLNTGNTVSVTIPIALENCLNGGTINTGDKVLLAGFGVGYSYGATIITV
ncbi:MAG: ketoacyl-ACP synthase III [Candidatus Cloacimonetes bacterium]|nr:ketoacyl-ACP synthase III [Candidatus Cloacimonadota bacterium]